MNTTTRFTIASQACPFTVCKTVACLLVLLYGPEGFCQHTPGTELPVYKTDEPIQVDGELGEKAWQNAFVAKDFYMNFPNDSFPADNPSEAMVTFDDRFLYVAFRCYTAKPTTQNMRRDFPQALTQHDVMYVNIGPYGDKANAHWFGLSYPGVQYDGAISGGGDAEDSYSDYWDAKWFSKVKAYPGYWVGEMAIPFKSFRFSNKVPWDINFLRGDARNNQRSHWVRVPVQYMVGSQAFQGKMRTQEPLPNPGKNVVLIPYGTFSGSKDAEQGQPNPYRAKAGLDAKVGLTPSLNLDLTLNPDYSHVEVDQQVVNLTRFEYNFPERRQFFLENSDLFGQLGLPLARPFFSRRLGMVADSAGTLHQVPILYGLRLSGKIGKAWRIGMMNLQTRKQTGLGLPDQNYSVAVVQRRVFSRSYVSAFFLNKQSLGLARYDSAASYHADLIYPTPGQGKGYDLHTYNRVFGLDFTLLTTSNRWMGKTFYHRSVDAFHTHKNYSYGAQVEYNVRTVGVRFTHQGVGEHFRAETGYVPGLNIYPGFLNNTLRVRTTFYPKKGKIISWSPSLEGNLNLLPGGSLTDHSAVLGYLANFRNQSILKAELRDWYQRLPADFNPIAPKGEAMLLKGQTFRWREYEVQFTGDPRKRFGYTLGTGGGGFYNGQRRSVFGELVYRYQPYGSFTLGFNYTAIGLPEGYGKANFLLVSPKLDITFTPTLYFTTFLQYNSRFDNVNLNARFQWRYKPVSDIFIVYTENYFPESFASKNRALVLKISYWLNL
jgi:hypothetical protein